MILVNSLDCLTGRLNFGLMYTQCSANVNYCAKMATIDPVQGLIIEKGCDAENFCATIGSRCLYDNYNEMEICCCRSNLCNGSMTYLYYWLPCLIITFIFITINL
ncbi:Uncharacterized protein BM_BM17723 [Brugia malayi]|uniref:UPAR/Ly6 domain-containing protein n=1 Tax=Brugia malayi TaxID=6279 RepID=A0A4E9FTF8_BRUMA|nr:Uncharacterized protein BM_BM17723 [Brugia malayi]VIO97740.1 Uncharacterized protein BM_BM17723 [Brugia malayi]